MFGSGLSRRYTPNIGPVSNSPRFGGPHITGTAGALARIEREARTSQELSVSGAIGRGHLPFQLISRSYLPNAPEPGSSRTSSRGVATFRGLTNFRAARSMRARAPAFPTLTQP